MLMFTLIMRTISWEQVGTKLLGQIFVDSTFGINHASTFFDNI